MEIQFNIEEFIKQGSISNELDFERAMIADRNLRLLSKNSVHFKNLRKKLRDLIENYENKTWSDINSVTDEKIAESDKYEKIAEQERQFINNRKLRIKEKLKQFELTQENLGQILGHKSKTHMSELMNGIKPFTLKDLILINRLLDIDLNELIPLFLSKKDHLNFQSAVIRLNKPKLKFEKEDQLLC